MYLVHKICALFICLGFIVCGCSILNPPPQQDVAPLAESTATPKPLKLPPLHPEASNARAAYVAEGNGHLYLCSIDSTKKLNNCSITGTTEQGIKPAWLPNYITVNMQNGINYAYVVSAQSIFLCKITPDKNLTDCHITGSSHQYGNIVKWLPTDIQFVPESDTTVAYITGVRTVYKCGIDNTGELNQCGIITGMSDLKQAIYWLPNGITFNRVGQDIYAYIAASNRVYQCLLGNDGNLVNCVRTGVSVAKTNMNWHPNDVVFTPQGSGFYAYVADPNSMYACNVDTTGNLLNCTRTGDFKDNAAMNWLPNTLAFNRTSNGKSTYVAGVYNVFLCDAQSNGMLSNCQPAATDTHGKEMVWNPKSIYMITF